MASQPLIAVNAPVPMVLFRFARMVQQRRADLALISRQHPLADDRYLAARYLRRLEDRFNMVASHRASTAEVIAEETLGKFGENGLGPAIDMMLREARAVVL